MQNPIDDVLDAVRAQIDSQQQSVLEQAARIKAAVDAWVLAVSRNLAAELAAKHGFEHESDPEAPGRALIELRSVVEDTLAAALPEADGDDAGEPAETGTAAASAGTEPSSATDSKPSGAVGQGSAAATGGEPANATAKVAVASAAVEAPGSSGAETKATAKSPVVNANGAAPAAGGALNGSHGTKATAGATTAPQVAAKTRPGVAPYVLTARQPSSGSTSSSSKRSPSRVADTPEVSALVAEFDAVDADAITDDELKTYLDEFAARARELQQQGRADPEGADSAGRLIRLITRYAHDRSLYVYGLSRGHTANWAQVAEKARQERERLRSVRAGAKPLTRRMVIPLRSEDAEEPEQDLVELKLVGAISAKAPVVIFGGVVKAEKLAWLRRTLAVEWIPNDYGIEALERRIASGRVGVLVVLQELIAHKHYEHLVTAARATSTPVVYADKGGKGALRRALEEAERMIEKREAVG